MMIGRTLPSRSSAVAGALFASLLSLAAPSEPGSAVQPVGEPQGIPSVCRSDCSAPFGQVLGVAPGDVPAYSNCNSRCIVPVPNEQAGTYTGIKWQCVEFARRWLLQNLGAVYGDVDVAADLWGRVDAVTRVADGAKLPLAAYLNGSAEPPRLGDLLIYSKEYLGTGHVAVVTEADLDNGRIEVAEQNFLNRPWPGDHARQIDLVRKDGRYWLLDPYLLGWKRVGGSPPRSLH